MVSSPLQLLVYFIHLLWHIGIDGTHISIILLVREKNFPSLTFRSKRVSPFSTMRSDDTVRLIQGHRVRANVRGTVS